MQTSFLAALGATAARRFLQALAFSAAFLTLAVGPTVKAQSAGVPVTQSDGVRVTRIGQGGGMFRMSFYYPYGDPIFVTYQEVYTNGYGPEKVIQVTGGHYATVWVRTPTVEIIRTEASAAGSGYVPSTGHTPGY